MTLNESLAEHAILHHRVTEYANKPDKSMDPAALGRHEDCPLGQWLSGDGAMHSAIPEYAALVKAHVRLHRASAETVRLADDGGLPKEALADEGELKTSLKGFVGAMSKMIFKVG